MAPRIKSTLNLLIKVLIAAGLILFLVKSGHLDLNVVWSLMTLPNVLLAVALVGLNTGLAAWRWILLLKARGFHIPFFYGISLYLIGMFFNYALPGAVSGDLVRGYYLVQDHPTRKMDAVLSVFIDRVLGLYSYFLMSLFAVAFDLPFVLGNPKLRVVALTCFVIFLGMTVFFLLSFSSRLFRLSGLGFITSKVEVLHRLLEGVRRFGQNRRILTISVLVSLFGQIFTMVFFYQMAVILHESDITWQAVLFVVPMGFVVTAVPIAPAGVGVGQVAFLYLFQTYVGHSTEFGSISITAFQICSVVWALIGAVAYLRRPHKPHELDNLAGFREAAPT